MRYFKQVIQGNLIYWELMGEGKDWQLNLKRTGEMLCGTDLLEKYLGMVKYLVNSKVVQLPEYVSKNLVYEETPDSAKMYIEKVKTNYIPVGEIMVCEYFAKKGEKVFEISCNSIYLDIKYLWSIVNEYYFRNEDGESCDEVYSTVNTGECRELQDCGLVYMKDEVKFKVAPDNSFVLINSLDLGKPLYIDTVSFWEISATTDVYTIFVNAKYVLGVESPIKEIQINSGVSLYFLREDNLDMKVKFIGRSLEGVK